MNRLEERLIELEQQPNKPQEQFPNNPQEQLSSNKALDVINRCAREIQKILPDIKGKKCIYFIGNTGSGKSTVINFLFGKRFYYQRNTQGANLLLCQDPICTIGYSRRSQTFLPKIVKLDEQINCCDCPGFKDTRHSTIRLGNAINLHKSLKNASEISFVIVISFSQIQSNRGQGTIQLLNKIGPIFGTNKNFLTENWDKIIVVVTRWYAPPNYPLFEDVLRYLTSQQPQDNLFVKLRKQNKILFVDPLNQIPGRMDSAQLRQQLARMNYIKSKTLKIGLPLQNDDKLLLTSLQQRAIENLGQQKPNFQEFAKQINKMEILQSLSHESIQAVTRNINKQLSSIIQKQKDILLKLAQEQQLGAIQGSQNIRTLVSWIKEFQPRLNKMTSIKLNGNKILEQFYKKKAQAIKLKIREIIKEFSVQDQNYPTKLRQFVAKFKGKDILSEEKERQVLELLKTQIERLIDEQGRKCLKKGETESLEENQGFKRLMAIEKLSQQSKALFPNFSVKIKFANNFLEKRKKIAKDFMLKLSYSAKQTNSQRTKINQLQKSLNQQKEKCSQFSSQIQSLQGQLQKQKTKNTKLDQQVKSQKTKIIQLEKSLNEYNKKCSQLNYNVQSLEGQLEQQKTKNTNLDSQKLLLSIKLQQKQQQDRIRFLKTFKKQKVIGKGSTWTNYTRQWTPQQWRDSGKTFKQITQLDLSGQNLEIIPQQLAMFPNLVTLDLKNNQIQNLGDLSIIKNIRNLSLRSNKITNIQSIQVLKNPWFIGLDSNDIENIQPLEKLTSLGNIYLDNNKIHTLANVYKLPNLKQLIISGNPLLNYQTEKDKIEQLKQRGVEVKP